MTGFKPARPFAPRPNRYLGALPRKDWRIKRYAIWLEGETFDEARFDEGIRRAMRTLPEPAVTTDRPGAAILILHQGGTADYVVLAWWDSENELPLHVWVRKPDETNFRPAASSESVCVWDLDVLWGERQLYVRHMIGESAPDLETYLSESAV